AEQLGAEHDRQQQADDEDAHSGLGGRGLVDADMQIEDQVTDACAEMVQISPDEREDDNLGEAVGQKRRELGETDFRRETLLEQVQHERKKKEHQRTAGTVEDGHLTGPGQAVAGDIAQTDVPVDRPGFLDGFCHGQTPIG
ncbi:hypothetical protein COLO4_01134, partial [Corchorus olitorius]